MTVLRGIEIRERELCENLKVYLEKQMEELMNYADKFIKSLCDSNDLFIKQCLLFENDGN